MQPIDVRSGLVDALRLDLVGPVGHLGNPTEVLAQSPSRWYLTGFLVPTEAGEVQRADPSSVDELDQAAEPGGIDDAAAPEPAAARGSFLPSSIGMSLLVADGVTSLRARVRYGEYRRKTREEGEEGPPVEWRRVPRDETVTIELGNRLPGNGTLTLPNSGGVEVVWSLRGVPQAGTDGGLPAGTKSLSVFLVNKRAPTPDEVSDEGFIFQAQLELTCPQPFVPRPNLRSLESDDWDERVADLQYRDACEYAVGHSVSTTAVVEDAICRTVRTCWVPDAEVEKVAPAKIDGVELRMEALAALTDGADAKAKLGNFVTAYRDWIKQQAKSAPASPIRRKDTAALIQKADYLSIALRGCRNVHVAIAIKVACLH